MLGCLLIAIAAVQTVRAQPVLRSAHKAPRIFVANESGNSVDVYPVGEFGNVRSLVVDPNLNGPRGIARDAAGRVYVANSGSDEITVYAPNTVGRLTLIATIFGTKTGLKSPDGVALDANGNIYVSNERDGGQPSNGGSVTVYPRLSNGDIRPSAIIRGDKTGLTQPEGIALDKSGNIYVVNSGYNVRGSLTIFKAGSKGNVAPSTTLDGVGSAIAVAVDAARNIFIATDDREGEAVQIFRYNRKTQYATYRAPSKGRLTTHNLFRPHHGLMAVNAQDLQSESTSAAQYVSVSADCSGLAHPAGIAVDRDGNIYVADEGQIGDESSSSVAIYAKGRDGSYRIIDGCAMPKAMICGGATGVSQAAGVTLDSKERIYVTDISANRVAIFAPLRHELAARPTPSPEPKYMHAYGAGGCTPTTYVSGNVAPIEAISSPDSAMDRPSGVAFDKSGKIYVANGGTGGRGVDSITIYPAGSYAHVAPIATIGAPAGEPDKTKLSDPAGVAVGPKGEIYSLNSQAESVTVYAPGSSGNIPPIREISGDRTWLSLPLALATDSSGLLYVLNRATENAPAGSVSIYAAGSNGNASPVRTISGARHDKQMGFDSPTSLAVDSRNRVYVTNEGSATTYVSKEGVTTYGPDSVAIYAANSNGNVAPIASISGPRTRLKMPSGIAVDSIGNIYVANVQSGDGTSLDSITVYPPGSNGNVAPAMRLSDGRIIRDAIIQGPDTGLDGPVGIALDSGSMR